MIVSVIIILRSWCEKAIITLNLILSGKKRSSWIVPIVGKWEIALLSIRLSLKNIASTYVLLTPTSFPISIIVMLIGWNLLIASRNYIEIIIVISSKNVIWCKWGSIIWHQWLVIYRLSLLPVTWTCLIVIVCLWGKNIIGEVSIVLVWLLIFIFIRIRCFTFVVWFQSFFMLCSVLFFCLIKILHFYLLLLFFNNLVLFPFFIHLSLSFLCLLKLFPFSLDPS